MVCVNVSNVQLQDVLCGYLLAACSPQPGPSAEYEIDLSVRHDDDVPVSVLGTGSFTFTWEGSRCRVLRKLTGTPVSSRRRERNAEMLSVVQLECDELRVAERIVRAAQEWQQNLVTNKVQIFRWCASAEYWRREAQVDGRTFDSVVLDPPTSRAILKDIDEFTSAETRAWYTTHCIPFRRGYLLHGPPGTGKTSLIVAIATRLQRPLHKVNLVAPKLCDDSLQQAMANVDTGAIVAFEDIDSLFGVHRDKTESFNVTFSGFLNAIDGLSDTSKGTLIIFTTNHPDRLDPALRRKGRVDLEFELGLCTQAQAVALFLKFYPDAQEHAASFASRVADAGRLSPAQLQHHFVTCRKRKAAEAVDIPPGLTAASTRHDMWT